MTNDGHCLASCCNEGTDDDDVESEEDDGTAGVEADCRHDDGSRWVARLSFDETDGLGASPNTARSVLQLEWIYDGSIGIWDSESGST